MKLLKNKKINNRLAQLLYECNSDVETLSKKLSVKKDFSVKYFSTKLVLDKKISLTDLLSSAAELFAIALKDDGKGKDKNNLYIFSQEEDKEDDDSFFMDEDEFQDESGLFMDDGGYVNNAVDCLIIFGKEKSILETLDSLVSSYIKGSE